VRDSHRICAVLDLGDAQVGGLAAVRRAGDGSVAISASTAERRDGDPRSDIVPLSLNPGRLSTVFAVLCALVEPPRHCRVPTYAYIIHTKGIGTILKRGIVVRSPFANTVLTYTNLECRCRGGIHRARRSAGEPSHRFPPITATAPACSPARWMPWSCMLNVHSSASKSPTCTHLWAIP
jgi:hypothetical protein